MKTIIFYMFFLSVLCNAQWLPDTRLTNWANEDKPSLNNSKWMVSQGTDVHMVWASGSSGTWNVWFMKSTNQGESWGNLSLVTTTSDSEFDPTICLDGTPSPVIHAAWTDNRFAPNHEIYYKRSTNGGVSWGSEVRIINSYENSMNPSIAASGSTVHLVWSENNNVFYKRSVNSGVSWEGPSNGTQIAYGTLPSIALSGTYIHVVYYLNDEIYYIHSLTDGTSWDTPVRLTYDSLISRNPSISVANQDINVVWHDNRDGNYEIYYKKSRDGGFNWEPDLRLSNTTSYASYNPSIIIDGTIIHVTWQEINYDARIMYKKSLNRGVSWTVDIVLTNPSGGGSEFPCVTAYGTTAHVAWQDTRDANSEIYYKRNPTGNSYIYKYPKNNINKSISDFQNTYDTLNVNITDSPDPIYAADINITIDTVFHTNDSDLEFMLIHAGKTDTIIYQSGGSGDNFILTTLDDSASTPIANGTAPFTGSFRPYKALSQFNNFDVTGNWILKIYDRASGNSGILKAWSLTIIMQNTIGIKPISSELPEKFNLHQNYPNPFNPVTKIRFDVASDSRLQENKNVVLKIYDILGREISTLVNEHLKPGTYEIEFDASKYSSGVYFYTLQTESYIQTKKMILIK